MERQFKIFTAIADIHIGAKHISASTLKQQLKDHYIKPMKDFSHLDGIFICGDVLHTIVSLNSDYSEVFYWFIEQVYRVAKKHSATVIIIKGTISHDNDQLRNIAHYQTKSVDFRICESVEVVTIWDNYKVLILPDVRIKKDSEIEQYLDGKGKYDLILGHGLIDTMQFFVQESENMPLKTYVFDTDVLLEHSKGPIIFGHIHQHQQIQNKFYYTGPFTILERGTCNAGFCICGISDDDRTKFVVEHYANPDSADYYDLDVNQEILEAYEVDDIVHAVNSIIENAKPNDLITLRMTRGDSLVSNDKVIALETIYRKDSRFSITKKVKGKKEAEIEQGNKERKEKYSYIMDPNMDVAAIMYRYYVDEYDSGSHGKAITEDDFRKILRIER